MKKLYFTVFTFLFLAVANAQIINFPDANFKAKLLAANSSNRIAINLAGNYFKIDANDDGEIEIAEALQISSLFASNSLLSNLAGIENFLNIELLDINGNYLSNLDLSSNTQLNKIYCGASHLNNLNIHNLTLLTELYCNSNNLAILSLEDNIQLQILYCNHNLLEMLDLNNNLNLISIDCGSNYVVDSINKCELIVVI